MLYSCRHESGGSNNEKTALGGVIIWVMLQKVMFVKPPDNPCKEEGNKDTKRRGKS